MITIETPTTTLEVRADTPAVEHRFNRSASRTRAGVLVVVGDQLSEPTHLTLRVRVADPAEADGVTAWKALLAAARAATHIHLHDSVVPVLALARSRSTHHGTWWEVELTWLPAGLRAARGVPIEVDPPPDPTSIPWLLIGPGLILSAGPGTGIVWRIPE